MEVKEIVENLKYNKEGKFQEETIIEARKRKEEVTEELLEELNKVANNIEKYSQDQEYNKHLLYSKIALLYDECGNEEKSSEYQKLAMQFEDDGLPF